MIVIGPHACIMLLI